MRIYKGCFLLLLSIVLLAGCLGEGNTLSTTKITIEPYSMSDKEKLLISKTSLEQIEFL